MTCGGRLENWERQGLIDRELMYYEHMFEVGLKKVNILDYGTGRTEKVIDSRFTPLPKRWLRNEILYSLVAVFAYYRSFVRSQIIKTNQSYGAWVGVIARLLVPGKKLVVRCGWVRTEEMMRKDEGKAGFWLWFHQKVEWFSFRFATAIIVASPANRDYVAKTYSIDPDKIIVVRNSVNTDRYFPDTGDGNTGHEFRIVLIGRLVEMKNFQGVIEAVANIDHSIHLRILGDGPYRKNLEDLALQLGVKVSFDQFVPNDVVPDIIRSSDLFILPQFYASGMPKVTLEAMACGVLTLSTDILTHRQIVRHGDNGMLCGCNADEIRVAIEEILVMPPGERRSLIDQALQDIAENHDMRNNAHREYRLMQRLINGESIPRAA